MSGEMTSPYFPPGTAGNASCLEIVSVIVTLHKAHQVILCEEVRHREVT